MSSLLERYLRHRFAWLFVSLLVTIGLDPILEALLPFDPIELLLALNLAAAIATAARERWLRLLVSLGVLVAIGRGLATALGYPTFQPLSHLVWLAAALLSAVTSARYAVRPGRVGSEHLFAALDTYLLVGLMFGVAYSLLDTVAPGSFVSPGEHAFGLARGIYFSFVTLATLGYGDIVASSDIARGITVVEAIMGQLYLAVLVARLVGLYGQESRS